jgi:tetratricopeptide (TPR) repeat protein
MTNRLSYIRVAALLAALVSVQQGSAEGPGDAGNHVPPECMIESQAIASPEEIHSQIDRFEKLAATCSGSGIYEARLGDLYSISGLPDKSQQLINSALSEPTGFERELRSSLATAQLLRRNFDGALATANALVADYPNWAGAYTSLGSVYMEMRQYSEAIPILEKANSLEEVSGTNLMLTMAYYTTGDYQQSALSLQNALRQDASSLKHTDAICAGSLSLLRLGHIDAGLQLLQKHVELVPNAKKMPNVQTVLKHYQAVAAERRTEAATDDG